jgi:UDP-N-acetylmuramoyl-tripeptide--D-alanyl-D-alanine ligase
VPFTLFLADRNTDAVVLEVGTNHPGEIATLAAVAKPDVAVVTNVAAAHLEGLKTVEGVLEEKGSLLDHVAPLGFCVLNRDDDRSIDALSARAKCRVKTYGVRRRADYMATMPLCDLERIAFHLNGSVKVRVPMLGCHNLYNALAALAVAIELGVPAEAAAAELRTFEGPPMRLVKRRRGDCLIIDDTYNANPGSMVAAIKTFASLPVPGRRVVVLGDMAELGESSRELHREVGHSLSCGTFDLVCAVGNEAAAILQGAEERGLARTSLVHYATVEQCVADLPGRLRTDDALLVKGSRRMGMERVVEAALGAQSAARSGRRVSQR